MFWEKKTSYFDWSSYFFVSPHATTLFPVNIVRLFVPYIWQWLSLFSYHCTKMYPMLLMCCSPLSVEYFAWLPHVLVLSGYPPVPKPILESQEEHLFSLLAMKPILAFEKPWTLHTALNPSLLQLCCREAWEPISDFQLFRPADVLWYCPSAISECNEFARWLITMKLIWLPILIPRQILEKGVLQ